MIEVYQRDKNTRALLNTSVEELRDYRRQKARDKRLSMLEEQFKEVLHRLHALGEKLERMVGDNG